MHRCDRCGAQAFMRAVNAGGQDLLFCGHHGRRHQPALAASGWSVTDRTDAINKTAGASTAFGA
ncbi:hypothetical protein D5H75_38020 [Bailinhaonella thermotolerans]|uniref:DUF7455 domain-containing protein n=1 Tax=Bailinhaonella thermotolerans TaxID=1070861 RepID=A0A3A4A0C5_9ACTN|nr:hypothetical protein D5H75_38020 [Bailinhaonella thermotolerans]